MHFVRIVSEYGSKLNKYQYILVRELSYEMTWLPRLYWFGGRKGREKKS